MIQIEKLTFGYKKNKVLFDGLNLELQKGKVYGLFGVNGAGKTTLIKQISGLLFPDSGTIKFNGIETKNREVETLKNLFIIPEEFWLPQISIENYISINAVFYPEFDFILMDEIMKEFNVLPNQKLHLLSYGQKKKFLIAFALASKTKLILMDEPTNGLDIPSKSQFRKIMAKSFDEDRCILISTHQVRDLASIIDNVIIVDNGKIRFSENVEDISNKLLFKHIEKDDNSECIYSEEVFGGKFAILENHGRDSEIDFELLFSAVIKDSVKINKTFGR